jgi:O-antigen/teichoic acid export membrane protein
MGFSRGVKWDLCLVGASQVLAAMGQLVGIRLLTEVLSPAVFGEASLILGVAALSTSTLINPTLQALLRYYPAYMEAGNPAVAIKVAIRNIWRAARVAVPMCLPLLAMSVIFKWITLFDLLLLAALVGVDGLRMFETTILNATRKHWRYGLWQIGEAWGRPAGAYLATTTFGVDTEMVLAAFVVTTAALYGVLKGAPVQRTTAPPCDQDEDELMRKFKSYARPLIPVGLISWTYSTADRYMIGALLSAKDVGTYVAVYGLASRPILMLSGITETAIRPVYYSSIGQGTRASMRYLTAWFLISAAGSAAVCLVLVGFHQQVAGLLLGPAFREGSYLAPWIAVGYGLLALIHITTRICLAYDATRSVLISEAAGAFLALAIGFPLVYSFGITGAAVAVPLYFGVQFAVSAYLARQSISASRQ